MARTSRSSPAPAAGLTADQVLRFRMARHGLTAAPGTVTDPGDAPILNLGVQDTGPDGAAWALRVRGLRARLTDDPRGPFALAWTLRGAPHAYRRDELGQVRRTVSPFSEADAGKRIFDAAAPLRRAGIAVLDALDRVAGEMRDIATGPIVKGEMSAELTRRLPEPYLRECRPCQAIHTYEQPFRLAALFAGLELVPGTSPPVLRPIADWPSSDVPGPMREPDGASSASIHLQPIRVYLSLFGTGTMQEVAAYLDAPVADVRANWPDDAVPVTVDEAATFALAGNLAALTGGEESGVVRIIGPYDPFLQARDRHLLAASATERKALFPVLGRPGAVVRDGRVLALWRPTTAKGHLRLRLTEWVPLTRADRDVAAEQATALADFRGVTFDGFA
ncbi:DNA glycosylase AlkZ-like family protein [Ruania rhizosphaerae]|uniref:DNA glycosylase AlkZ-like family protein n=1 Tax=Ruania rhizosphaerae TaxID=1840413 RepID=UPI00135CF38C|nr:crosslink repair DNA glycosylase YcaQ family protein [Ruania rhizosphaerae]